MTQSTSVFATGVEFAGDVLASIVVLFGLIAATKPPDDDHPYGHGRIETLAAFVVGPGAERRRRRHLLEFAAGGRRTFTRRRR